jgi:hypothetical protein
MLCLMFAKVYNCWSCFLKFIWYFTKNIVFKPSIRLDIRNPACGLASYQASRISGKNSIRVVSGVCRVQGLSCPGFVWPGFVWPGFVWPGFVRVPVHPSENSRITGQIEEITISNHKTSKNVLLKPLLYCFDVKKNRYVLSMEKEKLK